VHDNTLTMENSTVSGNTEGGVRLQNAAASNCATGNLPMSGGYNVLDDESCAFTGAGDQARGSGRPAL